MHLVRDINWSDSAIYRAGITPIYSNNLIRLVGIGISAHATNLTLIGGSFEFGDFDLLGTAVREYNEEVGSNLRHITIADVLDLYAIKTSRTIQILLPINEIPKTFMATKELSMIIWVTANQLYSIYNNRNEILRPYFKCIKDINLDTLSQDFDITKVSRSFITTAPFEEQCLIMINILRSGMKLQSPSKEIFLRRFRTIEISFPKIYTTVQQFKDDSRSSLFFRGGLYMSIVKDKIGIMIPNKTLYVLQRSNIIEIAKILNNISVVIYLADNNNVEILKQCNINHRLIKSLVYDMLVSNNDELKKIGEEFIQKLTIIRSKGDNIYDECKLIYKYEKIKYRIANKNKLYISLDRLTFYHSVNCVNFTMMENPQGVSHHKIYTEIMNKNPYKYIKIVDMIQIMKEFQMITENNATEDFYIS